jgi:hypothetical protein
MFAAAADEDEELSNSTALAVVWEASASTATQATTAAVTKVEGAIFFVFQDTFDLRK